MGNLQSMIKMWHECMVKLKCKYIILSSQCIGKCERIVSIIECKGIVKLRMHGQCGQLNASE